MTLILSGTDGLSDVDGSAATPAIRGTDANTGIFFGTDIIGFSEGGVEAARFNASGVFTTTNDATIQGLTVGRGAGAVATNTAVGASALALNTTGSSNTAVGVSALQANTTGSNNTAVGYNSSSATTTGIDNVAVGYNSLSTNVTGSNNTAVGRRALFASTAGFNTAVGFYAGTEITTGTNNVMIGYSAGSSSSVDVTTGSNNICISGNRATTSASGGQHQIVLATAANISGKGDNTAFISPNAGGAYQGNNSAAWSVTSDQRLKKNIVDNTDGLTLINQIRVRNFWYRLPEEVTDLPQNQAIAKTGVQLGVIAQELQQILPECVKTESTGVMTVDTDNLTWYLVNAIKELKAEIDILKGQV